mmetsp:Transcript_22454/g.56330  ORF Transcript_22454/g.56330 Transcript_22454/m.56330 type:complete len:228 (-) Transcript_22454:11-694(-)
MFALNAARILKLFSILFWDVLVILTSKLTVISCTRRFGTISSFSMGIATVYFFFVPSGMFLKNTKCAIFAFPMLPPPAFSNANMRMKRADDAAACPCALMAAISGAAMSCWKGRSRNSPAMPARTPRGRAARTQTHGVHHGAGRGALTQSSARTSVARLPACRLSLKQTGAMACDAPTIAPRPRAPYLPLFAFSSSLFLFGTASVVIVEGPANTILNTCVQTSLRNY